jgi:erythromycin esterase
VNFVWSEYLAVTEDTEPSESSEKRGTPLGDAIEEHAVVLETTDPEEPIQHPETVNVGLANCRILGLGEATHGTREFFRLKHRFFAHLVREAGVRVFAMEANFPEALDINDYVLYGTGDPRDALDNIYFWTWNVESVLSLIEWMRDFNEGRPLEDRVRFYGFDAQYTSGAVRRLETYLDDVGPDVPSEVRASLSAVDDEGTTPDQAGEIQRQVDAGKQVVPTLRDHLESHRDAYVDEAGERAWELATRHVTIIEQVTQLREAQEGYDGEDPEAMEHILRVRDRAMAANAEWILEFEETDPIVLWAHDAHINTQKHPVRDSAAVATPMGELLQDKFGEEYTAVGFSFGCGAFQALTEGAASEDSSGYELEGQLRGSPVSGTIDEQLDSLDAEIALVDIASAAADDRLTDLFCSPQPHFSAGATYDPGSPEEYLTEYTYRDAFDVLCYVEETTRARPLDADLPEP